MWVRGDHGSFPSLSCSPIPATNTLALAAKIFASENRCSLVQQMSPDVSIPAPSERRKPALACGPRGHPLPPPPQCLPGWSSGCFKAPTGCWGEPAARSLWPRDLGVVPSCPGFWEHGFGNLWVLHPRSPLGWAGTRFWAAQLCILGQIALPL